MALVDKLGNYIERLDRPNSDLQYGIDDVCGITNTKQLVLGTKANLNGRTFEKFSILKPREFIFNRRTSRNGERISLGFNTSDRNWILTEDYCHFRIRKDKEDVLDPDYLYLFFLNPEFDRYARYNSWGSATEFFNWEEIIETPISIIPISEQRKIVHDYQVITDRIELLQKMNENLEETMDVAFKKYIVDNPDYNFDEHIDDRIDYVNGLAMQDFRPVDGEVPLPVIKIRELTQGYCDGSSEFCSPSIDTSRVTIQIPHSTV